MKKRLVTIIITLLAAAMLAFGCAACSNKDATPPKDASGQTNWLTTVLEPVDGHMGAWTLVGHYVPGASVTGWTAEWLDGYTLDDLSGDVLPLNNYDSYEFWWKSSKYRITKIEFDLTAESFFQSELYISCPHSGLPMSIKQMVEVAAGTTKHVVFECDLTKGTGLLSIGMGAQANETMRLVNTKISNLKVTAEKI